MNLTAEVKRLWKFVNALAERVSDLEQDDDDGGPDQIGFEVDDPADIDDDESEY